MTPRRLLATLATLMLTSAALATDGDTLESCGRDVAAEIDGIIGFTNSLGDRIMIRTPLTSDEVAEALAGAPLCLRLGGTAELEVRALDATDTYELRNQEAHRIEANEQNSPPPRASVSEDPPAKPHSRGTSTLDACADTAAASVDGEVGFVNPLGDRIMIRTSLTADEAAELLEGSLCADAGDRIEVEVRADDATDTYRIDAGQAERTVVGEPRPEPRRPIRGITPRRSSPAAGAPRGECRTISREWYTSTICTYEGRKVSESTCTTDPATGRVSCSSRSW